MLTIMDEELHGRAMALGHAAYLSVAPRILLTPRGADGLWETTLSGTPERPEDQRFGFAYARNPLLSKLAASERFDDEQRGAPDLGAMGYESRAIERVRAVLGVAEDSPYVSEYHRDPSSIRDGLAAGFAALGPPDAPDATVQQTFHRMMKETVAPAFRSLGFTGSGTQFTYPSSSHFLVVAFVKSRFNISTEMQFEGLVLGRRKADLAAAIQAEGRAGKMPTPLSIHWREGLFKGLKSLARTNPFDDDNKWRLARNGPTDHLAEAITSTVREHALPLLLAYAADNDHRTP